MAKYFVFFFACSVIVVALARPQRDSLLDKQDVAANSVSFDKRQDNNGVVPVRVIPGDDPAKEKRPSSSRNPPGAQAAANMFSRIIDDIFQIPISVLQSVAKMLSGPVNQIGQNQKKAQQTSS